MPRAPIVFGGQSRKCKDRVRPHKANRNPRLNTLRFWTRYGFHPSGTSIRGPCWQHDGGMVSVQGHRGPDGPPRSRSLARGSRWARNLGLAAERDRLGQPGPSSQRSATPAPSVGCGASRSFPEETGDEKSRGSETNEKTAKVAAQIKILTPAIIARAGRMPFGPPAKARTGKEVRTITRLRSVDLRTTLRRLKAGDSFSLPGTITGFGVGGSMVVPYWKG